MSKFLKVFASAALIAGAVAFTAGSASAQGWHGGGGHGGGGSWHGGGWHGGGWGWRGGGWGWGWGWPGAYYGYGPYYGPSYYYAGGPGACGWVPVTVWRNGYQVTRRVWRCW